MSLDSILVILRAIIDISLVWMVIYFILKNIKNNVKMILLFKGVFVVLIVKILSDTLNLTTIGLLLEYVIFLNFLLFTLKKSIFPILIRIFFAKGI